MQLELSAAVLQLVSDGGIGRGKFAGFTQGDERDSETLGDRDGEHEAARLDVPVVTLLDY